MNPNLAEMSSPPHTGISGEKEVMERVFNQAAANLVDGP